MSDLSRWCFAHYQTLKDFAGPVATVIAAVTAVGVTWRLGSQQVKIAQQQARTARQQAGTALDRLRYDLFEKRYSIYEVVTQLLQAVYDGTTKGELNIDENVAKFMRLEEARFFFPPDTVEYILEIRRKCDQIMVRYAQHRADRMGAADPFPLPQDLWDELPHLQQELYALPQRFKRDLGFAHVLGGSADRCHRGAES